MPRPLPRASTLLWLLLTSWLIVQVWSVPIFPSQDGPLHLYIAWLLERFHAGTEAGLGQYFGVNASIEPNVAAHFVLELLLRVTEPQAAERWLVTLYVLLFAGGARYAVRSLEPRAEYVALLFLPFALGLFLHKGFYNYCFGTALYLWSLGFWWRHCDRPSLRGYVGLALLAGLLTVTHLFGWIMLALTIGTTRFAQLLLQWREGARAQLRRFASDAACTTLALLPGIFVLIDFFQRYSITQAGSAPRGRLHLLEQLLTLLPLQSFGPDERWSYLPLILLLAALTAARVFEWLRRPHFDRADQLGLPLFALLCLYFFSSVSTRDVPTWERLLPFLCFVGLLWLAARPWGRRARAAIATVAILCAGLGGWQRIQRYQSFQPALSAYLEAGAFVEPGTELLAVHLPEHEHRRAERQVIDWVNPFRHASARLAMAAGAVDLRNSLVSKECYGYFPVVYRSEFDPYRWLGLLIENEPPELRLADFEQSGESIDYVLLWGAWGQETSASLRALKRELACDFELVWQGHGTAAEFTLYRHRGRAKARTSARVTPARPSPRGTSGPRSR